MTEREISFTSGTLRLAGTLQHAGDAPGPAAVLISGSGPIDRDSNQRRAPIGVSARLADGLVEFGVSSFRYDKRGVGASDGEYLAAGFHDNVADARAALDALRARPEVDPSQLFVVGHSEGALIAAELASDPGLAGVVLLAGSAQSGRNVLEWQARQIAPTLPTPVRWLMRVLRQDLVRTQANRLDRIAGSTDDVIRVRGVKLNARWFREFMVVEPSAALRSANVPILAITGAKDVQVDPDDIDRMADLVAVPFDGHVVEDVSHLLRHDPGPKGLRDYKRQMRQPLDPRVVALLGEWVVARAASADPSLS